MSQIPSEEITETGHAGVDAVLETLHGLEERPVGEHVAVFEAAHEHLRAALSDASAAQHD